jgi:hypothetical protein
MVTKVSNGRPSNLHVKQNQIKAEARTSFLKMCSDSHHHRFECMQKHHQWKEQRKTLMYLEASRRITIEILNVCGRLRETKRGFLNVFRIIKGKPRNVYEVNKRKNRRKLGCM